MIRPTQTICRQQPTNYLSLFDHFAGFAHKALENLEKDPGNRFYEWSSPVKAPNPLWGDAYLTIKISRFPGTNLIDLGKIKGCDDHLVSEKNVKKKEIDEAWPNTFIKRCVHQFWCQSGHEIRLQQEKHTLCNETSLIWPRKQSQWTWK